MKAVLHTTYGGPEVLRFTDVETPSPADGDVLVRTHAVSLNARDWHLLRGDPYLARLGAPELGLRGPRVRIRGTDFAGTVDAVGPGVTDLAVGDEVFGEAPGAFAEYVVAPRDRVERKPATLTMGEAAALPLAANTALIGLREVAGVGAGQSVLINGASGGVGLFAVQLAAADGAEVTAVCSTRNVETVRSMGAHTVVDYTIEQPTGRYDVVFDLVGNRSLGELRRLLAPGGTLLLSGGGTSDGGSLFGPMGLVLRASALAPFVRERVVVLEAKPTAARLTVLRELADAGVLRPLVERTVPLAAAADAVRRMETEHTRAKIVLAV
ncbi:NAD(P)-dependent alcohol dehydrogenase [Cryptosporangium arvum]|uniref:NAD(P)-dependent alcohol dehydrogenase n=1 Tax=Cryptosporangium arvum TaxID=80871 RepID=UPI0004B12AE4|nr:NAD(P)-dependent alcohol dehydrogenase [Cryptosporangium arvum]